MPHEVVLHVPGFCNSLSVCTLAYCIFSTENKWTITFLPTRDSCLKGWVTSKCRTDFKMTSRVAKGKEIFSLFHCTKELQNSSAPLLNVGNSYGTELSRTTLNWGAGGNFPTQMTKVVHVIPWESIPKTSPTIYSDFLTNASSHDLNEIQPRVFWNVLLS